MAYNLVVQFRREAAAKAGLMLLREVDRRLDLIRRIDEAIPDPRDPLYTSHPQSEILTSRIFGRCSQQIKSGKSNSTPRMQYPA